MSKRDFSPIAASLVLIAALFLLTVKSLEGQPGRFYLGTADNRPTEIGADGATFLRVAPSGVITAVNSAVLSGFTSTTSTLTSPVINGTVTGTADDWSTPTFAAGDYTASDAQTWTVAAGDVVVNRQRTLGSMACFSVTINTTSVSGTPATLNYSTGITAATSGQATIYLSDNGTVSIGAVQWTAASPIVKFQETGSAWATATDTTAVRGSWCYEI